MLDWSAISRELITLFVVIDPVGTIPVYLFAVKYVPRKLHRRFALRAVGIATLVLLAFLVGGQYLLETLGLRLGSFQIAGGVILFLFALTMIFGDSKPSREIEEAERDHLAGAVFPLAMPSIASPGAMPDRTPGRTGRNSPAADYRSWLYAAAVAGRRHGASLYRQYRCQHHQPGHGDCAGNHCG